MQEELFLGVRLSRERQGVLRDSARWQEARFCPEKEDLCLAHYSKEEYLGKILPSLEELAACAEAILRRALLYDLFLRRSDLVLFPLLMAGSRVEAPTQIGVDGPPLQ